jgi:SAM-dependent methyltransferase
MSLKPPTVAVERWLAALEARHLADFRAVEVTRALRALSSAYVQRRHTLTRGGALDSAGKRAAFALYYGPLHFFTVRHIVRELAIALPANGRLLDLGCGTGAAGAAWVLESAASCRVTGIDRHPAAVEETRWTYKQLGIDGSARQGDIARTHVAAGTTAILAAYALNELPDRERDRVWRGLLHASGRQVLVVEPIARGIAPWWDAAAADAIGRGGRVDEWRFRPELPEVVKRFDRAAGLDHREVTARSICVSPSSRPSSPSSST